MGRLLRIFFNTFTVLLTLLTLATLVAWPWSYRDSTPTLTHRWSVTRTNRMGPVRADSGYEDHLTTVTGVLEIARFQSWRPYAASQQGWSLCFSSWWRWVARVCSPDGWRPKLDQHWSIEEGQLDHFWSGTVADEPWSGCRLTIPLWWLAIGCGALPGLRLHRYVGKIRRARRRRRAGLCVTCGYDLRATPQRCPECGAQVDVAAN